MITSSMEIITPEKAKLYLEKNTNNYRILSKNKVRDYANDIRNGLWVENGEGIVFGANGELKDGQHRLNAIVEADKPIMTLVVRGVNDDVNIFDSGMGRSAVQVAKANGYPVTTNVTGAVKLLLMGFSKQTCSRGVLTKYLEDHYEDLREAGLIAMRGANSSVKIGKKTSCCLATYCVRRLGLMPDEMLEDFFWVFNNQSVQPNQMRDPSAPLIAARQFINKLYGGSTSIQKKQVSVILQAMDDFKKNKNRRKEYKLETDVTTGKKLNQLRALDGIPECEF